MVSDMHVKLVNRRHFLSAAAAGVTAAGMPGSLWAQTDPSTEVEPEVTKTVRRNISSFRALDWRPYFKTLGRGAILVDTQSRALHFWSKDEADYLLFPTSVPLTEDMTRLGRTEVVRKVEGPSWRPTPSMKKRNPEWPDFVGPGPDNPLGTHALYLSWQYYRIHGTHDTRKIGRRSSNGCIGLYNEHIAQLYEKVANGTQVLLI